MLYKIDFKLLGLLIIGFVLATIIGTVSHEYGHYLVAKYYGYESAVHYGYTSMHHPLGVPKLTPLQRFFTIAGGPLQTFLTGAIGLLLLYWNRKAIKMAAALSLSQWVMVYVALFWLRFSFNLLQGIPRWIKRGHLRGRSDEIRMTLYLECPSWLVSVSLATIGVVGLSIVLFYFVPIKQRFTFMLSGIIGGVFGFYFWLYGIGPILMP